MFKMNLCLYVLFFALSSCGEEFHRRVKKDVKTDTSGSEQDNKPATIDEILHLDQRPDIAFAFHKENKTILAGSRLNIILDLKQPASQNPGSHFKAIVSDSRNIDLGDKEYFATYLVKRDMSASEFETLANDKQVKIVEIDKTVLNPEQSMKMVNEARVGPLVNYTSQTLNNIKAFIKPGEKRVKVGIIDTGFDLANSDYGAALGHVNQHRNYTSTVAASTEASSNHNHGPQMASIIGHPQGFAHDFVEMIPLKVTDDNRVSVSTLARAIADGTNLGVEVMNMSIGGTSDGCPADLGYVIQKAIKKGVTFVVSAGNGEQIFPEVNMGYPVVAARDHGPLNFARTSLLACWSMYFKGMIGVGSVRPTGGDPRMPFYSNYSKQDLEIVAPGFFVPAVGLNGQKTLVHGTSPAAAVVSAAAAIAIYHQKSKGLTVVPRFVEDILMLSTRPMPENVERVSKSGILDFTKLVSTLKQTESMNKKQRQDFFNTNQNVGTGWTPGEESNLRELLISQPVSKFYPEDYEQVRYFKAHVVYRHNSSEVDVSTHSNTTWISSFKHKADRVAAQSAARNFISVANGKITVVNKTKLLALKNKIKKDVIEFVVFASYDEDQHQVYSHKEVTVSFNKPASSDQFNLVDLATKKYYGQLVRFDAINDYHGNINRLATWTSNKPNELRVSNVPGVFDATQAKIGGSYQISATYKGITKKINFKLQVESKTDQGVHIHSHLGGGNIVKGQMMILDAVAEFTNRPQYIQAKWFHNGTVIADKKSQVKIDTSNLSVGTHSFGIQGKIGRFDGDDEWFVKRLEVTISEGVESVKIFNRDPILSENSQTQLELRVYNGNNSYEVITDKALWTTSDENLMRILGKGVAFTEPGSGGNNVHVDSSYKGKSDRITINVVKGSDYTGSQSKLDRLELKDPFDNSKFSCGVKKPKVNAIYKDGQVRVVDPSVALMIERDGSIVPFPEERSGFFGGDKIFYFFAYNDGLQYGGYALGQANEVLKTSVKDGDPYLKRSSFKKTEQNEIFGLIERSLCYYDTEIIYPSGYTADDFENRRVPSGSYSFTFKWKYNGSGEAVQHEIVLRFDIIDNNPTQIKQYRSDEDILTSNNKHYKYKDAQKKRYVFWPSMSDIWHTVVDAEGSKLKDLNEFYNLEDFTPTVSIPNQSNVKVKGWFHSDYYVTSFCQPYSQSESSVSVLHKTTNSRASGKNKYDNQPLFRFEPPSFITKKNLVIKTAISANTSKLSECSGSQGSSPHGTGTLDDPFIVCSKQQFTGGLRSKLESSTQMSAYILLGNNINFGGDRFDPLPRRNSGGDMLDIHIDGDNHSLSNFSVIDVELNNMGIFEHLISGQNIIIDNAAVKGKNNVGALCGECDSLKNIYVKNSNIIGERYVGGIAGRIKVGFNLVNDHADVGVYRGTGGGVVGIVDGSKEDMIEESSNSGDVTSLGVPGEGGSLGGLVGEIQGAWIINSISNGNVTSLAHVAGGLVGKAGHGATILYSELRRENVNRGNIVAAGAKVGGLVGFMTDRDMFFYETPQYTSKPSGWAPFFELDRIRVLEHGTVGVVYGSKSNASIIGGYTKEALYCTDLTPAITRAALGRSGVPNCENTGEESTGGSSATGGLVGYNAAYMENNQVSGTIRSVNQSGGLAGYSKGYFPAINNDFDGIVSVSSAHGSSGKIVAAIDSPACKTFPHSGFNNFLINNTWSDNQEDSKWEIGSHTVQGFERERQIVLDK